MPNEVAKRKPALMQAIGQELRVFGTEIDALDARAADRFGLNQSDLRCLDVLSHSGPLSPTLLARALEMTTGGLSISLGRLERAGYITREMDRTDRRRVTVELTQKARDLEAEIFGPLLGQVGSLLTSYSKAELALIHEFLQRVRTAVAAAARD